MTDFDSHMERHQVAWRKEHITVQEMGTQNGLSRQWILPKKPENLWREGLWSNLRDGAISIQPYLKENDIPVHTGAHNLKSSWTACINFYYPFRSDLKLVEGFLRERVSPEIAEVQSIELEYAEKGPFFARELFREPGGQRSTGQTSPDVAFLVRTAAGKNGLILVENKLTEHSFYPCSGRKREYGNPDRERCLDFQKVLADVEGQCYLCSWEKEGRENRRYWKYLHFSATAKEILRQCPATMGGYQLLRQQAMAEAFTEKYDLVFSSVAFDARNDTLRGCLAEAGVPDFTTGWKPLFSGKASFATWTHQEWVAWVRTHDSAGRWQEWLNYVTERYDL